MHTFLVEYVIKMTELLLYINSNIQMSGFFLCPFDTYILLIDRTDLTGLFKQKTIKLIFVASPLSIQN